MRTNFSLRNRIHTLVALLLIMFCLTQLPARGQFGPGRGFGGGKVIMQDYHFSVGIVPSEKLRITGVNPDNTEPIHANLKVFDVEGNKLIEKATVIQPRAFRYMDIDPDEIVLRGGEPNARLQMFGRVELRKPNGGVWEATNLVGLPTVFVEIITKSTGSDSMWIDMGAPVMTTADGRRVVIDGLSNTFAFGERPIDCGLVPGQKMRISTFNGELLRAIKITLRVWDPDGNPLAQREMVIAPGRHGFIDFAREDFDRIGEPFTNRLQVALTVTFSGPVEQDLPPDGTSNTIFFSERYASLEIVQEGRTVAGGHVQVFNGRSGDLLN